MNKKVCKQCYLLHGITWRGGGSVFWWNGIFHCPILGDIMDTETPLVREPYSNIEDIPVPPGCFMALEQVVMGQKRSIFHRLRKYLPWWALGKLRP